MDNFKRDCERAARYLEEKAGAMKRPSGKYLRKQEIRLRTKLKTRFNKQMNWLIERIQALSYFQDAKGFRRIERKTAQDDVADLLDELPEIENIASDLGTTAGDTYKKGTRDAHKKLKMAEAGISFEIMNPKATEYIEKLKTLHLSDYRGSITRETKKKIQQLLLEGIDKGTSYTEMSRQIKEQGDAGVFSRARGELIAVNQVGTAYGTGNDEMIREYMKETSAIIQKKWEDVGDDHVTPECTLNSEQGWLGMDEHYPSGDTHAPRASNPRCRCAMSYRRVDMSGNPI